jgi:serine/threonine protein kinase
MSAIQAIRRAFSPARNAAPRAQAAKNQFRSYWTIGGGGCATVSLGSDHRGAMAAIKSVITDPAQPTISSIGQQRRCLLHEAEIMQRLKHRNIVGFLGSGEVDGKESVALELLFGTTLEQKLNTSPGRRLPPETVVRILIDVLSGLAHAHEQGIIHRDLKPANIMLAEDGRAVILDFGVAVEKNGRANKRGRVIGTPLYLSPEQARAEKVDERSDLFSLGLIAFRMLFGFDPFLREGKNGAEAVKNTLKSLLNDPPPRILFLEENIPELLRNIIIKLLQKDPGDRYQSAREVLEDLERLNQN